MELSRLNQAMRAIASAMENPVIILLLLLLVVTIFLIGWLISEIFTEHRHLKEKLPHLVDVLNETKTCEETKEAVRKSRLLKRQRNALLELLSHPDITPLMRESLAARIVEEEQNVYSRRIRISDIIAKIGPILGLLGTLIPLGPGIIALGQGDTITLSSSLLTAFDTTILGLLSAGTAMVISTIRKSWYNNYMSVLETLAECILEVEKRNVKA